MLIKLLSRILLIEKPWDTIGDPGSGGEVIYPTLGDFMGQLANVLNYLGLISGIFVSAMFIYGAVTLITAGGDAEKVKKAQGIMTNSFIGLIVIVIGELLIRFVLYRMGFDL